MAKLTGEIINKGLRVWVMAYESETMEPAPVELEIVTGVVERDRNVVHVVFANRSDESLFYGISRDPKDDSNRYLIYLGDDGVRPYNYDDRCTQVFTTKEETEAMIEMCAGRYPNFVCEDGSDKELRAFMDFDEYDYED